MNRNAFAALYRHRRHAIPISAKLRYEIAAEIITRKCVPLGYLKQIEVVRRLDYWLPSCLLHRNSYSTSFTNVHGETPSADYARMRRESLENKFGLTLGTQSSKSFNAIYRFGPFLPLYRAAIISYHVLRLTIWQLFVQDIQKRAIMFRETLIRLGPFYIKLGQALSTRPDILPTVYCQELSKLQDQIPPFPTDVAIRTIEKQFGAPIDKIFSDISPAPIAAASLGQVYKAHLHTGELVAVKVQRPGMSLSLTLDALLFHMIGDQLKRFAKARKDLLVAVNEMVRHMFDEIDYVLEGKNAERFVSLYCRSSSGGNKHKGMKSVKAPRIFWDYTCTTVLTMEWMDGIKLTDETGLNKASLNRRELIDQGLYCSLRQMLEDGYFHADPHPGNLVATKDGSIAYFDFGMMGEIPRHYRIGLIQMIVHFVNRDSLSLANDFLSLGFIPEGVDIHSVSDALQASFSDRTGESQDFQGIMSQLYDVMYEFNFSLPPDYALVIRALGSLEGTAKVLDPDFKVIESAYPFVIGRLIADPSPDMRRILRELLIRNNGSIRWNRLERLVAAISEQASEQAGDPSSEKISSPSLWKLFDMHAVVDSTEDLFKFILSEKGHRVRLFLLRDIVEAADVFLQDEVIDFPLNERPQGQRILLFEVGLLIGKFSSALDRVFIFDLIPTPQNDSGEPASYVTQPDKKTAAKSKSNAADSSSLFIDKDWVAEHARQVSRMLVGGIKVVGVYVWVSESAFKNSTIMLCQAVKGVAEAAPILDVDWSERLLLHICYGPKRWNCRNCSLSSNITSSSLRPCDFKMGKVLSSFQTFRCMHNFNLRLPILRDSASKFQTLSDVLHHAISIHAKELSDAKALIDGKLVLDNEPCSSDGVHEVELLIPFLNDSSFEACSQRDVCGILSFSGTICSFAYLNSKEPISQAVSDIKGDITTSLQSRLDIICDEADGDSGINHDADRQESDDISVEKPVSQLVLHLSRKECNLPFPRRVFAPWLSGTYVCDYLQPSETVEVLKDHCMELLSVKAPTDVSTILEPEKEVVSFKTKAFWDLAVPYSEIHLMEDKRKLNGREDSSSNKSASPGHMNVLAAGLILLLSVLVAFVLFVLNP